MPRCRLLIHLNCQQWSLILWLLLIQAGIDYVHYLSIQYQRRHPGFLPLAPVFDSALLLPPAFLFLAGLTFHPHLIHTSASLESRCHPSDPPSDRKDKAIKCSNGGCSTKYSTTGKGQQANKKKQGAKSRNVNKIILLFLIAKHL